MDSKNSKWKRRGAFASDGRRVGVASAGEEPDAGGIHPARTHDVSSRVFHILEPFELRELKSPALLFSVSLCLCG